VEGSSFIKSLMEPLNDPNFRRLLIFSGSWAFTVIMSGAFFAVYMLKRIGLPMSAVVLLAVLSQVTNIYWFKLWGRIADRYNNKSVLRISVPLFILVILLYPFTTMPERYALTIPLLIFIHILGGISTAGFNLCAASIALRLAPQGKATAYLATNAFCSGLAATIAPIFGGLIGSYFAVKEISFRMFYNADTSQVDNVLSIPALSFRGIDFIFFGAAIVGIYAWHRLSLIEEAGDVVDSEVRDEVLSSLKNSFANPTSFSSGMRRMSAFPYEMLRKTSKSTSSTIYRVAKAGVNQAQNSMGRKRDEGDSEKDK
jgi:MFS family permease